MGDDEETDYKLSPRNTMEYWLVSITTTQVNSNK